MSNSRVETRVDTPVGELSFQEYFVQRWYQDPVKAVRFAGATEAEPAPGVVEAIMSASAVIVAPSNPITSIGPILSVPGIRDALRETQATVAAVSPIVGDAAVSGPAGILMAAQGFPVSIAGVAQAYEDFLDILIADLRDAEAARQLTRPGLRVHCTNTIMRNSDDKAKLARTVLALADDGKRGQSGSGAFMILVPVKNLSGAKQRLALAAGSGDSHGTGAGHAARRARDSGFVGGAARELHWSPAIRSPAIWRGDLTLK